MQLLSNPVTYLFNVIMRPILSTISLLNYPENYSILINFVAKWVTHKIHLATVFLSKLDTFCFNPSVYVIGEDNGDLNVLLEFSKALQNDTIVKFRVEDLSTYGKMCIKYY